MMSFLPIPDVRFRALWDISPVFLREKGIKLLLLDLDNTMAPYTTPVPSEALLRWREAMREAGIRLYIVSNNKGDRPMIFAGALDIPFIKLARKPSRKGLIRAMEAEGMDKAATALVGDQIYTDVFAAKRLGIRALLVEPIRLTNPLHALRYIAEIPFRIWGRKA